MTQKTILDIIVKGPRDALKSVTFIIFFMWQSVPAVLGLLAYTILVRIIKIEDYKVFGVGAALAITAFTVLLFQLDNGIAFVFTNGF